MTLEKRGSKVCKDKDARLMDEWEKKHDKPTSWFESRISLTVNIFSSCTYEYNIAIPPPSDNRLTKARSTFARQCKLTKPNHKATWPVPTPMHIFDC